MHKKTRLVVVLGLLASAAPASASATARVSFLDIGPCSSVLAPSGCTDREMFDTKNEVREAMLSASGKLNGMILNLIDKRSGIGPGETWRMERSSTDKSRMGEFDFSMLDRVINRGIRAGAYPGAVVIVRQWGQTLYSHGYGTTDWGSGISVEPDNTIYDLASLTKVLATTNVVMVLVDRGLVELDQPVSKYLSGWQVGQDAGITVRQLLLHRSGLPAGRELWKYTNSPAVARQLVLETRPVCAPGACYIYSDLGADVLGFMVEQVTGMTLDRAVDTYLTQPLGLRRFGYLPPEYLKNDIPVTEKGPPRGHPAWGEVHDENAYALGGVAGHAGLFGTAQSVADMGDMMLFGGTLHGVRLVGDSVASYFVQREQAGRALGWDTCKQGHGTCGVLMSEHSFGHTGFTGTSIWLDPERGINIVVLSNRVDQLGKIRAGTVMYDVRSDIADATMAVVDGSSARPGRTELQHGWLAKISKHKRHSKGRRSVRTKRRRGR